MTANPQRENGFTGIANEILDRVAMLKCNGTQFRIIMVVFRYTYGFQRKEHELSESFLAKATNMNKQQIKRELKDLIDRRIITLIRSASFDKSRVIAFNKHYEDWTEKLISMEAAKEIPDSGLDTSPGSELVPTPGSGLDTQERNVLKENSKENSYIVFSHWNLKNIITHKTLTDKISGHIKARLQEKYSVTEIIEAIDNYEIILKDNIQYFWSYKWGLSDFLVRGLDRFKTESDPFNNYLKKVKQGGQVYVKTASRDGQHPEDPKPWENDKYWKMLNTDTS